MLSSIENGVKISTEKGVKICIEKWVKILTRRVYYDRIFLEVVMNYFERYAEKEIKEALESSGTVVVTGPKFVGKTTTSKLFAKSMYTLDTKMKIDLAQSNPESILIGHTPRLIDEWQNVPDLWNCARSEIDRRDEKFGQFIFTGSSTPANKEDIFHSGAGRIVTVPMFPMTLSETKESKQTVSLSNLFSCNDKVFEINEDYSLHDTAFYICRGGWPLTVGKSPSIALKITENYCNTLFEFENSKNKKFRNKKSHIFKMILRSYARNISTEVRRKKILFDINEHDDRNLNESTFDEYIEALNDLFIIKDIDAWNPNFRSKTSIITSPTRHFVDTSIAANVLGLSPDDLMNDPKTFGFFFEDFAVKELNVYAHSLGGEIRHFRDSNGLECDAVLHLKNGKYGLIEIKLGGANLISEGKRTLELLRNRIIDNNQTPPSFCMILTAVGDAFTLDDGTHVVPINMLTL